jgi:preprotein translocase subunit SecE
MSMNREQKRLLQRQGAIGADGTPVRQQRQPPPPKQRDERTSPKQFVHEVRGEMRKVVWPTKAEVINYSIIVFVAVVVLTAFIAGLDWLFGTAIIHLYE